ncbi:VasL domain-containing protein [Enterobacter mori]|uniref:VasL domain-containing protein n=1 Tax=Enterobacter mori TaxID=539813 RepID=UPI003B83FBCE
MIPHTHVPHLHKLKINSHDPRGHQSFLLFSNDMAHWKTHISNNEWWLEREKQCLDLFRQYGYDLQNGLWYCLIACQRSGWQGVSAASLLLADGFARQQNACWPPLAAQDLRRQILEWYCTLLLPVVHELPRPVAGDLPLRQLLNAAELLRGHASALHSSQLSTLQQFSGWLNARINDATQPVRTPVAALPPEAPPPPPVVRQAKRGWQGRFLWSTFGAALALFAVALIQGIKDPAVLVYSNEIWPGNAFYVQWRQQLEGKSAILPGKSESYQYLNQQLDMLEERLIDAEQKRKPYVTISELKTTVYRMRQATRQQEMSLEHQLHSLQTLRDERKEIPPVALASVSVKLDALNSRFLLLSHEASRDN